MNVLKQTLIAITLLFPGSMWLALATDLSLLEHTGIVLLLFGGTIDGVLKSSD